MFWILISLISPLMHGVANVLDNYLANKLFKNIWTLTFYSSLLNVVFIPFVFLIQIPDFPPQHLLIFFFIVAIIDVLYLIPYYKALQQEDTSVITALFSLGRIFVPIFAFFTIGETLSSTQYVGFLIVILCGAATTFNSKSRFKFNTSFFYMIICSIMLAIQAVVYKYIFNQVSWSTGFLWPIIFSCLISLFFLFIPVLRKDIWLSRKDFTKNLPVFVSEEIFTFIGSGAGMYAISLASVSLVKSISSFQAIFVLIYAIILHRFFPTIFREDISYKSVCRKIILFIIMIGGIILIVR